MVEMFELYILYFFLGVLVFTAIGVISLICYMTWIRFKDWKESRLQLNSEVKK